MLQPPPYPPLCLLPEPRRAGVKGVSSAHREEVGGYRADSAAVVDLLRTHDPKPLQEGAPREDFSPGSLLTNDRPDAPPPPLVVEHEARAQPANIFQPKEALTSDRLPFLTFNGQKAGSNIPSLVDIVSLLDLHTPEIMLLTETPLLPSSGALTHILRNRGYKIHYHPINGPSSLVILPMARLPDHLTHSGGVCCIAYRKNSTWATHVRTLRLPTNCAPATTCAVEITLHSGKKAAIVDSYLPQPKEEHDRTF
jgi:hypothetical protein